MPKIKLDKPWTYRTPEKTISYEAGEHEVYQYIADKAEAEGVIGREDDGDTGKSAKAGTKGTAGKSKS